ncbi:MAG: efflux RND transporter periplasmic adaptor subunit [Myxococcota bacterium]|nr:efflux RND transporter periplasmic adaptor subunit [Myxococcota bacterium]
MTNKMKLFVTTWVVMVGVAMFTGCRADGTHSHAHGDAHGHGHGHETEHAHDHGDTSRAVVVKTHFTDRTELFVEFAALVKGEPSVMAAHLTRLTDYSPVTAGMVTVVLSGGGHPNEVFSVNTPSSPGIFRPTVTPEYKAERQVILRLKTKDLDISHDLGELPVYAATSEVPLQASAGASGGISFLKEQQWKIDFGIIQVVERSFRQAIPAYGKLIARSGGKAIITAPVAGRVLSVDERFVRLGDDVAKNQTLSTLSVRSDQSADPAALQLAREQARLSLDFATAELGRLTSLYEQGAVAERRVLAARKEVETRQAEYKASMQRLRQHLDHTGQTRGRKKGNLSIRTPIAGTITRVLATPGAFVEAGAELFHVADLDQLWLEARVTEANVGKLVDPQGAWFQVDGFEAPFETGDGALVTVGGVVDEQSRTVPVIFELVNPDRRLRIGMSADVRIVVGQARSGLAVPQDAILHQEGQEIAFVMVQGETFERRLVELGIREAGYVEVTSGLDLGERVVDKGAFAVRLAGSAAQIPSHGHTH